MSLFTETGTRAFDYPTIRALIRETSPGHVDLQEWLEFVPYAYLVDAKRILDDLIPSLLLMPLDLDGIALQIAGEAQRRVFEGTITIKMPVTPASYSESPRKETGSIFFAEFNGSKMYGFGKTDDESFENMMAAVSEIREKVNLNVYRICENRTEFVQNMLHTPGNVYEY